MSCNLELSKYFFFEKMSFRTANQARASKAYSRGKRTALRLFDASPNLLIYSMPKIIGRMHQKSALLARTWFGSHRDLVFPFFPTYPL